MRPRGFQDWASIRRDAAITNEYDWELMAREHFTRQEDLADVVDESAARTRFDAVCENLVQMVRTAMNG